MEVPTIPDLLYTELPASPGIKTAYTFNTLYTSSASNLSRPPIWLIFINGLGLPQAFWQPTISHLKSSIPPDFPHSIYTTTYDRAYQGLSRPISTSTSTFTSTPAPTSDPPPPGPLHSFQSTITELSSLLTYLSTTQSPHLNQSLKIFISHSIGAPLSRLYISSYPHQISALLSLDSNVANIDLSALFPDPSSPSFSPERDLPPDTTIDQLIWSKNNYAKMFAPNVPNAEGLDRSELPSLLPFSDQPVLSGPKDRRFVVRVVAHDPDTFAEEGLKICTRGLTERIVEPVWREYNQGLLRLDGSQGGVREDERDAEIVVAKGAGHFVQRDRPDLVAEQTVIVIGKVLEGSRV